MRKLLGCTRSSRRVCGRDGVAIVVDRGAVGRPYFAQNRPGSLHDVRDAEAVANLDQFASRDDGFSAGGEFVQT